MFNAVRRFLGYDQPQRLDDRSETESQPNLPSPDNKRPCHGYSVPLEANHDPNDSDFYAEFQDKYLVVPASDGESVLVYSVFFKSELPEDQSVVYDDEDLMTVRDGHDPPKRLAQTIRLYEHLFRHRESHPRVVRYLGPTSSGFRLERFWPGFVRPCRTTNNDAVLALHQRWALQILSALQWIHERGVTMQQGAIQSANMWLRSDYSIALAGFVTAGCQELDISADDWPSVHFTCPWGPQMHGRSEPPYGWEDTGLPKGDISDWATWVYGLMTGSPDDADPLFHDLEGIPFEEAHPTWLERGIAAERGNFKDWPRLPDKQLGQVLINAWNGKYETANETLVDARRTLRECGRELNAAKGDEIDGFNWHDLFEVGRDQYGGKELTFRAVTGQDQV